MSVQIGFFGSLCGLRNAYAVYGEPESIASVRAELWSGLENSPVDSVEGMLVGEDRKLMQTYK